MHASIVRYDRPMSHRASHVATEVRMVIAPVLRECPRECGIVSITALEISPDGAYATASISALKEPKLALEFLKQQTWELQKALGKLPRRPIPKLRFRLDEGPSRGSRIDELLEQSFKELPEDR
jgi:ribosome-binding factor A